MVCVANDVPISAVVLGSIILKQNHSKVKNIGGGGGGLQGSPRYSSALIVNKEPKLFVAEHTMPLHDPIKICKYI